MLSRSIVSLWTAVLVWPTVGGLGGQAHGQDTRPAIAVFPFDNGGSYGQDKDNFDALQKGIAGLMISDLDRKSTRLNSSHSQISYAVFCLKKKKHPLQHGPVTKPSSLPPAICN